ncbi:FAD:protein FMN transferase [Companilactobacillus sp.]|uniref:FAD:protein FMN transferase n=1 Tax=Companilactobacillus sp. TaxID=2767905 RepID=UPI0026113751|nr:FAD:protein FMN transferase [Companilactobacillus sp.]
MMNQTTILYPNAVIDQMTIPFTVKLAVTEYDDIVAEEFQDAYAKINAGLAEINQKFSPFQEDSLVSEYRRTQNASIMFDDEFQSVYGQCTIATELTDGYFDPFFDGGYNPTGLVKGWAIQSLFNAYLRPLLDDPKIVGVSLNGGGDMQLGARVDSGFVWNVGIEDPNDLQRIIAEYHIQNGAIATSGMNKRGQHIRRRPSSIQQVTMVANDLTVADVWATAGIAAGTDKFEQLISESKLTGMLVDTRSGLTSFAGGKINHATETQI